MENKLISKAFVFLLALLMMTSLSSAVSPVSEPGTIPNPSMVLSGVSPAGSLSPFVEENGMISVSIDGVGSVGSVGPIDFVMVEKPAGATVRSAYLLSSTVFGGQEIPAGGVLLSFHPIIWDEVISDSGFFNQRANVTDIVKSVVDGGPAQISIPIMETDPLNVDGNILVVIFDDPNQVTDNTVVLMFGRQDPMGIDFELELEGPIDKSDPNFVLDMSLGISFSYQGFIQHTGIDINGQPLTRSAGGFDDGVEANGGLLTVGGVGDSNANPVDPFAPPVDSFSDDELYDLLPFVNTGDKTVIVHTMNVYTQPTNDDNLFFASFFVGSAPKPVPSIISLSPDSASNALGTSQKVTAFVQDEDGELVSDVAVSFEIFSGPNAGMTSSATTNVAGEASFEYIGQIAGSDEVRAGFMLPTHQELSNVAIITWSANEEIPEFPTIALPVMAILGLMFFTMRRKDE